jgi:hypothetical protein
LRTKTETKKINYSNKKKRSLISFQLNILHKKEKQNSKIDKFLTRTLEKQKKKKRKIQKISFLNKTKQILFMK